VSTRQNQFKGQDVFYQVFDILLKMLPFHRRLSVVAVILVSVAISLQVSHFLAVHFFFDKLFYQKSAEFGYHPNAFNSIVFKNIPPTITQRVSDLSQLLTEMKDDRVLGTSTTDEGVYKIALIGDSYVYGQGITAEQRFGNLLEKQLNKIRKTKVYFLAQNGDNIVDNYDKFLMAEKIIHPNMSIITMVNNDLFLDEMEKYPLNRKILVDLGEICPGEVWNDQKVNKKETKITNSLHQLYFPAFSERYSNLCFLQQISKEVHDSKEKVLFLSFGHISEDPPTKDSLNYEENLIFWKYAAIVRQEENLVLDVTTTPGYTWSSVSPQEGHPSAATNRYYAQSLYQEIIGNPRWEFFKKEE
jgi:hypothetical protein